MNTKRLLRAAVWAWAPFLLLEFTATHWPEPPSNVPPSDVPWDKLLHFSAYVVAGALVALALRWRGRRPGGLWIAVGLALAAYSLFDEATQPLFGRDSEWLDWAADLAGIAVGMTLVAGWPWSRGLSELSATTIHGSRGGTEFD